MLHKNIIPSVIAERLLASERVLLPSFGTLYLSDSEPRVVIYAGDESGRDIVSLLPPIDGIEDAGELYIDWISSVTIDHAEYMRCHIESVATITIYNSGTVVTTHLGEQEIEEQDTLADVALNQEAQEAILEAILAADSAPEQEYLLESLNELEETIRQQEEQEEQEERAVVEQQSAPTIEAIPITIIATDDDEQDDEPEAEPEPETEPEIIYEKPEIRPEPVTSFVPTIDDQEQESELERSQSAALNWRTIAIVLAALLIGVSIISSYYFRSKKSSERRVVEVLYDTLYVDLSAMDSKQSSEQADQSKGGDIVSGELKGLGRYHVVAGAFDSKENAQKLTEMAILRGYNALAFLSEEKGYYIVSIMSSDDRDSLQRKLSELEPFESEDPFWIYEYRVVETL